MRDANQLVGYRPNRLDVLVRNLFHPRMIPRVGDRQRESQSHSQAERLSCHGGTISLAVAEDRGSWT
jgi:hypothetical protein